MRETLRSVGAWIAEAEDGGGGASAVGGAEEQPNSLRCSGRSCRGPDGVDLP